MPDPAVFTYDVFISYSHANSEWVLRTLLPRLEDAGLKVCVDTRDFRPGAARLNEVARAVTASRKTLMILTPPYLADEWAESGNLMVQSLDPASRDLRMVPLLKERCEPPLRIRHLTCINFADPDDPAWPWTQLLTALGAAPILEAPPALAQTFRVSKTSKVSRREEAIRLAGEALVITERSGYVLQGADVHPFLAEIEIERWYMCRPRGGWRRATARRMARTRSRTTRPARCWQSWGWARTEYDTESTGLTE